MSDDAKIDKGELSVPKADDDGAFDLTFHYIKSHHFRVVHVDGLIGGLAPAMDSIELALFSEREPFPTKAVQRMYPNGTMEEIAREGRDGITREIEINAIMTAETAELVGNWLLEQAEILKAFQADKDE